MGFTWSALALRLSCWFCTVAGSAYAGVGISTHTSLATARTVIRVGFSAPKDNRENRLICDAKENKNEGLLIVNPNGISRYATMLEN